MESYALPGMPVDQHATPDVVCLSPLRCDVRVSCRSKRKGLEWYAETMDEFRNHRHTHTRP